MEVSFAGKKEYSSMNNTPQTMQVDNGGQFSEGFVPCFNNPWEMANSMQALSQSMNLNRSLLMNLANGRQFPANASPLNMVGQFMGKPNTVVKTPKKRRARRKKWKKPKDKPKRPLSAYNLFFQEERERMIRGDTASDSRRGLGFGEMARVIASKWNSLVKERRYWYERGAEEEKKKYFAALAEWKKSKEAKNDSDETPDEKTSSDDPASPSTTSTASTADTTSSSSTPSLTESLSESLAEMEKLSEDLEESPASENDIFAPISLEEALQETEQELLQDSLPEMERVLATISDLKDSYDEDFVDFVSTLDFE